MTHSPLTNRSVLVTGGTGSFGQAFVAHALAVGARRVAVFSRDELKQSIMFHAFPDDRMRFMLGDVRDRERLELAMRGVEIVIHAAAMKQIPACEASPTESKETNVDGSANVAMAAVGAGVWRAVFLSTDKASAPNTLYGAHKMAAERAWTQANVYAAGTRTRLIATRYGNVIGSRGSVVPLFQKQAAAGGPLTLTDHRMTRFWMRLGEAVTLVETALTHGRGGEVFVPRIKACSILTVAEAVAPGLSWVETGIRRGEKLHEQLIGEDESRDARDHGVYYTIEPDRTWEQLPVPGGARLLDGFTLRSDIVSQFTVDQIREMIG